MGVKHETPRGTTSTDRIERRIVLRAPRSRVWRAITTTEQSGAWFGMKLDGAFDPGQVIRGKITYPDYEHLTVEMWVERIEPEHYFSYRWHPYAIDSMVDYSAEPTTLVEFHVEDHAAGTAVTIAESGFDRLPLGRRAEAFHMNDQGWGEQVKNLARYVS